MIIVGVYIKNYFDISCNEMKARKTELGSLLVSIIIPIFRTEWADLDRCVNSVIAQTYKELEIIMVDDGNEPSYSKRLECYSKKDNRIIILHKTNGGLGNTRNYGVENTKGDYVFFLDSDDYLSPYSIENAVYFAKEFSADIVVGGNLHVKPDQIVNFSPKENKIVVVASQEEKNEYINHIIGYRSERFRLSIGGTWDSACYRLVRKDIAKSVHFENDKYWDEDDLWNLSIIPICNKIIVVDNLWYACVINPNSMTRGYKGDRTYEFQFRAKQEYERIKLLWPDCMQGYYHLVWDGLFRYCRTDVFHKGNPKTRKEKYSAFANAISFSEFSEAMHHIVFDNDKRLFFKAAKAILRWLLIHNSRMAYAYLSLCTNMINE